MKINRAFNGFPSSVFLICLSAFCAVPAVGQNAPAASEQPPAQGQEAQELEGSWIWYGPGGTGELTFANGGQTFQLIGYDGTKHFTFDTKIETSRHEGVCFLVHRNEEGEITYRGIYKLTEGHFYEIPPRIQADRKGQPEVRDWRRDGSEIDKWLRAARDGNTAQIEQMLKDGMQPDATINYSMTALAYAAAGGHIETMKLLIEHGADVAILSGWWGNSATNMAAKYGQQQALELLVKHDAPLQPCQNLGHAKVKKYYGNGPVHEIAFSGELAVLDYLLNRGAQLDAKNLDGVTPLMLAVIRSRKRNGELSQRHVEAVKTFLAKGANPGSKNEAGKTAMDFAKERDLEEIIELLSK